MQAQASGMSYIDAALMELEEEAGIKAKPEDLIFLGKVKYEATEPSRNVINDTFCEEYAYGYEGKLEDLKPEEGFKFEAWSVDEVFNGNKSIQEQFIPVFFQEPWSSILRTVQKLAKENG